MFERGCVALYVLTCNPTALLEPLNLRMLFQTSSSMPRVNGQDTSPPA